ncbi:MAG: hypothetical protein BM564_10880 [Bacteroidetes bacterium MedPE-SWsnd-G2]|nr:MAG: hypothetical protein BM564_10880 [Bacteroidetes bacterium MedPE-SWsnd-G2]
MNSDAFILVLAYPDTVVRVADEWYSQLLKYVGVGSKGYVRAGHSALVLIRKQTGVIEYFDFGRYITPAPMGRVRCGYTDFEIKFPFKALVENDHILNVNEILSFLANSPRITHGQGKLYASVSSNVNYKKAVQFIRKTQKTGLIRYGAFIKNASNCSRFVADVLGVAVTDSILKRKLKLSNRFTPSPIGNVIRVSNNSEVYCVADSGEIELKKVSMFQINKAGFLDRLPKYTSTELGSLLPIQVDNLGQYAKWVPGIGAGAWFDLYEQSKSGNLLFKRVNPYGTVDVHGVYESPKKGFSLNRDFKYEGYADCRRFSIRQHNQLYHFKLVERIN